MYHGIVMVSVIMFGIQFLFNERYEKLSGLIFYIGVLS